MKLLFCVRCWDVVKLAREERSCKCGNVSGHYLEDGWHAEVSENAHVIGINNKMLRYAVSVNDTDFPSNEFDAWLFIPGSEGATRIKWRDNDSVDNR